MSHNIVPATIACVTGPDENALKDPGFHFVASGLCAEDLHDEGHFHELLACGVSAWLRPLVPGEFSLPETASAETGNTRFFRLSNGLVISLPRDKFRPEYSWAQIYRTYDHDRLRAYFFSEDALEEGRRALAENKAIKFVGQVRIGGAVPWSADLHHPGWSSRISAFIANVSNYVSLIGPDATRNCVTLRSADLDASQHEPDADLLTFLKAYQCVRRAIEFTNWNPPKPPDLTDLVESVPFRTRRKMTWEAWFAKLWEALSWTCPKPEISHDLPDSLTTGGVEYKAISLAAEFLFREDAVFLIERQAVTSKVRLVYTAAAAVEKDQVLAFIGEDTVSFEQHRSMKPNVFSLPLQEDGVALLNKDQKATFTVKRVGGHKVPSKARIYAS